MRDRAAIFFEEINPAVLICLLNFLPIPGAYGSAGMGIHVVSGNFREIIAFPSQSFGLQAKIHILIIEKIILVKISHLLEEVPLDEHKGPGYPIAWPYFVVSPEIIFPHGAGQNPPIQNRKKRCEGSFGILERIIDIQQFASHDSDSRMCSHELHHRLKRMGTNENIGVQDQYELPRAFPEGAINPRGKAKISRIFQKAMGSGKMFDNLSGLVGRMIIDDDDLMGKALDGPMDGSDTPGYKPFGVISDDKDG
jgi:hypothetical protein